MFTALVLWALALPCLRAQVCSPQHCFDGDAKSSILAVDYNAHVYLTPGSYSSDSDLPSSLSLVTPSGETVTSSNSSYVVPPPSQPLFFSSPYYGGEQVNVHAWQSAFFPDGWYGLVEPGVVVWGPVPDVEELPISLNELLSVGSDACEKPCGSGGACTPNANNTAGTCTCLPGWTRELCDTCQAGYFGETCQPCNANCTICDDGQAGTGVCLGTTSTPAACGCAHGACTTSGDCICAAGWTTASSNKTKCSTCAEGFYEDTNGNCLTCPLGCASCKLQSGSTPACTSCVGSLSLSSANPPTCVSQGECNEGTYWDSSNGSCQTCSPACTTCTGPAPSDCLACASPRVNLNGQCVGYDASNGVCDSSLSKMQGVFVVNNGKQKCDACPAGCLGCTIPSFSSASSFDSYTCQGCQEGYLMQAGKCVKTCGDGFYLPTGSATTNGTCQACDSSCSLCVGTATTCTRCSSGLAANGKCVDTCPSNTFATNGTCLACSTDCATCSAPLSSTSCLSCPSSRPILSQGRCITFCPRSSYFDSGSSACKPCDSGCASCTGPSAQECTSCNGDDTLTAGKCAASSCGTGGFVSSLGVCLVLLVNQDSQKSVAFIAIPIVAVIVITAFCCIRRQRKKTQQDSATFARNLRGQQLMKRLRELKIKPFLGMDRVREPDPEVDIVMPKKKKVGTWDSYMDLEATRKWRDVLRHKKREEIPLEQRHEAPPPYYPSTPGASGSGSITTASGGTYGRAEADSKTKIMAMNSPTSPDHHPRALRPPPRPHRAPASDGAVRTLHRAGGSVRFDDIYGESARKSLPDVPYSPVFGTAALGEGRAEHGWV